MRGPAAWGASLHPLVLVQAWGCRHARLTRGAVCREQQHRLLQQLDRTDAQQRTWWLRPGRRGHREFAHALLQLEHRRPGCLHACVAPLQPGGTTGRQRDLSWWSLITRVGHGRSDSRVLRPSPGLPRGGVWRSCTNIPHSAREPHLTRVLGEPCAQHQRHRWQHCPGHADFSAGQQCGQGFCGCLDDHSSVSNVHLCVPGRQRHSRKSYEGCQPLSCSRMPGAASRRPDRRQCQAALERWRTPPGSGLTAFMHSSASQRLTAALSACSASSSGMKLSRSAGC